MILFASLLVPGAAFAEVPDYSLASNWLDGFPAINASVDTIFFSTTGAEDTKLPDIVSYDNESMRKGVALYTFNNASPFLKTTNCFIPFYSQSHLRNFVEKTPAEMEEFEKAANFKTLVPRWIIILKISTEEDLLFLRDILKARCFQK